MNPGTRPFSLTLVMHGPEIFDRGEAAWLLDRLRPEEVLVAGIMARTAAEESGLPVIFDGRRPSDILRECNPDQTILACSSKNTTSSGRFGSIIASRLPSGLIHLETAQKTLILWNRTEDAINRAIARRCALRVVSARSEEPLSGSRRTIAGCLPGEPVFVNGIIIGTATRDPVVIEMENGTIRAVSGLTIKDHGIEKLHRTQIPELASAWCKSGMIRRSSPSAGTGTQNHGRIIIVDHDAAGIYERIFPDVCGILAVGDDTSAISAHIGMHLGLPVLGITDGDLDGIIPEGAAPGTLILKTCNERDDDIGEEIIRLVPHTPVIWEEWVAGIESYLGDRVIPQVRV